MLVRHTVAVLGALSTTFAAPATRRSTTTGFDWGNEKIRGVNIGGWLVLEPYEALASFYEMICLLTKPHRWITPSIFQTYPVSDGIVDEYTMGEKLGYDAAYNILKPHWDSWVQLSDFQKIADSGFNMVRIPVGYWAYDNSNSPYVSGSAPYIDLAIGWARQTNLMVIIDLHGAPGSQNGFDNSGQRLAKPLWQEGDTVKQTLAVLETIQTKYGDSSYDDVVAGIELLNEPLSSELDFDVLKQFERDGFGQQRAVSQTRVVVIQDGFQAPNTYNGWLTPSDDNSQNVALDHHEYQVFTDELVALQPWQHRQYVCNNANTYSGADKWTIVGEWTAAMTDCASALNGE